MLRRLQIPAGIGLAMTFVVLWGAAASAHVTVQPATAEKGARGSFVVRVPNESATAHTTKVAVQTPKDTPLTGIRVQPKPGWTTEMTKSALPAPIPNGEGAPITDYVSEITWTAVPGNEIGPDQYIEFPFTTGALPKDVAQVTFKAVQTYDGPPSEGASPEVLWTEVRQTGQPDPKRPEPLVKLTDPVVPAAAGANPADASGDSSAAASTAAADAKSAADSAKTFAILALLLGLVALIAGIGTFVARPKPAPASGPASPSGNSTAEAKTSEPVS
jgi:uncharacterized protein YcnI